jgi:hypothetical protein
MELQITQRLGLIEGDGDYPVAVPLVLPIVPGNQGITRIVIGSIDIECALYSLPILFQLFSRKIKIQLLQAFCGTLLCVFCDIFFFLRSLRGLSALRDKNGFNHEVHEDHEGKLKESAWQDSKGEFTFVGDVMSYIHIYIYFPKMAITKKIINLQ